MIHSRYGEFPLFWQELEDWEHWKEVEVEYSKFLASEPKSEVSTTKISRWADASSKLSRSHWDYHRPYIPPGIFHNFSYQ